ncbi:type I-E CRISPR-associated protein Cas7/Cse4/CasC [Nocardioides yefusunii]|uniref:Type I-E CRISPR-associated protein Cas7/Cse4/CasC n=1 Tax=Nocardioides yefusunii TaxID=2500546 RepID=A0ABW1R0P2_9ACTN|nr:type I-E CRISPR-associated protein Cas7/Cse4/CasC [Nocardioides yefusunii]
MTFVTVHVFRALPMHNLNRDQNGLPKSQFDGGIQRGRLSSQALKRPARIAFREAVTGIAHAPASVRTMDSNAVTRVVALAGEYAQTHGKAFDEKVAKKRATSVVTSLAKTLKAGKDEEPSSGDASEADAKKDNILLFSDAEIETLAQALVDEQNGGVEAGHEHFVQDFVSPSLDVAAFGRMFAAQPSKSTQAAVAVSHAVMTHAMSLTLDYFTAVDEAGDASKGAGAAHIDSAYYTSGVYYSTFTIDPAQLARSWSGAHSATASEQVAALVKALVEALPTGRLTNTNAHTKPFAVLVEEQRTRTVYEFETPVEAAENGGFTRPTVRSLAAQVADARSFDSANYVSTALLAAPSIADLVESDAHLGAAESLGSVDDLSEYVASLVMQQLAEATA